MTYDFVYTKIAVESGNRMLNFIKRHKMYLFLLTLISIFVMLFVGFYTNKLGHDMGFHVTNIENLAAYLNPLKGKIVAPDIMPHIGQDLGYGLYLFYPSLPHLIYAYIYRFLSLFHIDILTSILFTNILFTIFSSWVLYLLSYTCYKNKHIAFITGVIFILFPYRLSCIFTRYALNESLLFLFVPLILLSLVYLKEKRYKSFFLCFCMGYIGMIYSHLVMSFYFTILLIPYLLFYRNEVFEKGSMKVCIKAILFVSIFVLPSIVSVVEHRNGKYLVFLDNYMTSVSLIEQNILNVSSYFVMNIDDWKVQHYIPIFVFVTACISLFYVYRKRDTFTLFLVVEIILIVWINSSLFPWRHLPFFFLMIQFPWRLHTFLVVYISLLSPLFMKYRKEKWQFYFIFMITLIITSYPLLFRMQNRKYEVDDMDSLKQYAVGNMGEYYPDEYYKMGKEYYESRILFHILDEKGRIIPMAENTFPNVTFEIKNPGNVEIELPRIYYKGYVLKKGNKIYPIRKSTYGLIEADVDSGIYTLTYQKTICKRMVIYIKYGFLLLFSLYFLLKKYSKVVFTLN